MLRTRLLTAVLVSVGCSGFVACGTMADERHRGDQRAHRDHRGRSHARPADGAAVDRAVDVPEVALPDPIPTELVITEVTPGDGPEAADGDVVLVNYVGVRSEDGTQFDSNFGAEPFAVVLGQGGVIAGWDQGLVGRPGRRAPAARHPQRAGLRRPTARGDVIQAGDALSFVIDVAAVGKAAAPPVAADLPVDDEPATELVIDDARVGDGATLEDGQQTYLHLLAARGDTGEVLQSTWELGGPQPVTFAEGGTAPFLLDGLAGMQVGGRRILTVPFEQAFGAGGRGRARPPGRHRPDRRRRSASLAHVSPSSVPAPDRQTARRRRITRARRHGPASVDDVDEVEAEVEDPGGVGQLADGDVVDTGLADLAGDLQRQPAAGLEDHGAAGLGPHGDGGPHVGQRRSCRA